MIAKLFKTRLAHLFLGYFNTRAFYHGGNNHFLTIFGVPTVFIFHDLSHNNTVESLKNKTRQRVLCLSQKDPFLRRSDFE